VGSVVPRVNKCPHVIAYASRTLDEAQINYITTKKKLFAIVIVEDKFCSHLLSSKITVFIDHSVLKFFLKKSDTKLRLLRWMLLLQEFDLDIKDRSGVQNQVADHLSMIKSKGDEIPISDKFPNDFLYVENFVNNSNF